MSNKFRSISMILALILLLLNLACAPTLKGSRLDKDAVAVEAEKQKETVLQVAKERDERLACVANKVRFASVGLCGENCKQIGFVLHDLQSYKADYRQAAKNVFGVGDAIVVRAVQEDYPAELAGIQIGDTLVTIDGKAPKTAADAIKALHKCSEKNDSVALRIRRNGSEQDISVSFIDVLKYPVILAADDVVNAYADGDKVLIATGMIRFCETDDELALVVAHELAHNGLGHLSKKKGNWFLGTILDIAVTASTGIDTSNLFGSLAANAFSQEFEAEADYMGLYMMKRSGYDIAKAPEFWRRMAAEYPGSIKKNFLASHPTSPERFLALDAAVKEIDDKLLNGEELIPDKK